MAPEGVALVTGGSRGIGAAAARALADAGWPVAVNYRSGEREAAAVVEEIRAAGGTAEAFGADVSDPAAVDALVREVEQRMGRVLVLVNNAGIRADALSLTIGDDAWERVLETNLTGAFRLIRRTVPGMVRSRFGRVINISSIAGAFHSRGQANYAASKAGLIGLTKTVAAEVASRGVTVNAVLPGYIETEMTTDVNPQITALVPVGRFGRPDEVAACVRFLASEAASYVTGTTLTADGGYTA